MNENIAFGGIKRVPGGATGSDGDLAVAVDVCNDGMSLELLENPKELFDLDPGEELLCIHEPEGEGKHYITQLVVGSSSNVQSAPVLRDGSQEPSDNDSGQIEESEPLEPVTPVDPYIEPEPDVPPAIDGEADFTTVTDYIPSSISSSYPTISSSDYEDAIEEEQERYGDNGGSSVTPTGGATTVPVPTTAGIYLMWRDGAGNIKQHIEITAYGKVNSIQPMGNTLVCNHEGDAGNSVAPEIRYYIFKTEDGEYVPLGSKPPFVNITFGLESTFEYWPKTESTFKDNNTKYKKYGGVNISSYAYSDTVSVYYGDSLSGSYVPPYGEYSESILDHWSGTYSIENVTSPDGKTDVSGMKVNWTTMALGCYNKFIAEQSKENKFVFPFYVRYAYELYDGSLIMHSYPVLMIPNSRGPIFGLDGKKGLLADRDDAGESYEKVHLEFKGRTYGFASTLMHNIGALTAAEHTRLENWKDLIRGINIYVTPPIYNYKQGGQVLGWHSMSANDPANGDKNPWRGHYTQGRVKYGTNYATTIEGDIYMEDAFKVMLNDNKIFWRYDSTYKAPNYCLTIPQKDDKEVLELHENAGQFYKLVSIEYEDLLDYTESGMSDVAVLRDNKNKNLLNTISNQDLMQDDSGSHDTMSAEILYGYNRRLNMAKTSKVLHSPLPLHTQLPTDYTTTHEYHEILYVGNGGKTAELRTTSTTANVRYPKFLFYPNTEAKEAVIIHNGARYKVKLKEHKALNGAFWLSDFLNDMEGLSSHLLTTNAAANVVVDITESNKVVDESNKIYTSETNNPFYVPPTNINIAGGGEVRALCSAVEAMSQGQFGQHPMYCFTSEGVWAMSVDNTGGWSTIQPVARDVISAGTKPLSLDSAVVFMTNRGLLLLGGSETKVLSDDVRAMMSGEWSKIGDLATATATSTLLSAVYDNTNGWVNFPDAAKLMYDARNGRIYVSDGGMSWVYNLKSGLWTQATTSSAVQITSYPECETQMGDKVVKVSVDRTDKSNLKPYGLVVTQPFKFGAGGSLRRIHEMVVRGEFRPYGSAVKTALWGTRDWLNHALVASSTRNRLTRWGGSPYFAHSLGLFVTREGSGEWPLRIAGADFTIDGEHDNKLR